MESKTLIDSKINNFKKGLDYQREVYKSAKAISDIPLMCSCIENIKSEIKSKAKHANKEKEINYIESRINWIKNLKSRHRVKTKHGYRVKLPSNWRVVSMNHLQNSYEKLMIILNDLGLL